MNCIRSFTDLKEQRQLHYEAACEKDTKKEDRAIMRSVTKRQDPTQLSFLFMLTEAGKFLSSSSAWDRESLGRGPGMVGMEISGPGSHSASFLSMLTKGRQFSKFFCKVKKRMCFLSLSKN